MGRFENMEEAGVVAQEARDARDRGIEELDAYMGDRGDLVVLYMYT